MSEGEEETAIPLEDEEEETEEGTAGEEAEEGAEGDGDLEAEEAETVEAEGGDDTSQTADEGIDENWPDEEDAEESPKGGSVTEEQEGEDLGEDESWEGEDEEKGEMGPAETVVREAADMAPVAPAMEAAEDIAQKAGAPKVATMSALDDLDDAGGVGAVEVAVLVAASAAEEVEVPDEDRTRYVWEGSCSSSSEEDVKKKRRKRMRMAVAEDESTEEETEEVSMEEEAVFSREEFLEEFRSLIAQQPLLLKKNELLQKNVYDYCQKRKMEEVYFAEVDRPDPKLLDKYERQLEAFEEHVQQAERSRATWQQELERLEEQKKERVDAMLQALQRLVDAQRAAAEGLLSGTTGKPLTDKAVEKLVKRLEKTVLDLHAVRLRYIRLRDELAAAEGQMKRLETETFGEGMHLLDYEQLRMENQSYSDKIEERDEELTRLRGKATSAIQQLGHIREKASATAANIADLYDHLEDVDRVANSARDDLGQQKHEREELRKQYHALRTDAGLLVHKRLLRDFDSKLKHSQGLEKEIEQLKEQHARQQVKLTRVKETIKELCRCARAAGSQGQMAGVPSAYDLSTALLAERRQSRLSGQPWRGSADQRTKMESIRRGQPGGGVLFPPTRVLYTSMGRPAH